MPTIVISHRSTGAVLYSGDRATLRDLVEAAVTGWANLSEANLHGANLSEANLSEANFGGANLSDANLGGANLRWANLHEANLGGADLGGADLSGADLSGANLSGANLSGANLSEADLGGAVIPEIPAIDAAILAEIRAPGNLLRMDDWHSCDTTHCRAGWAIHLAGEAGYALERRVGPSAAGALIYAASRPGKPVPDFSTNDTAALADLEACAADSAS